MSSQTFYTPEGTLSEIWAVWDEVQGFKVAIVHMYVKADGTNSTPDPKFLRIDGVVLTC